MVADVDSHRLSTCRRSTEVVPLHGWSSQIHHTIAQGIAQEAKRPRASPRTVQPITRYISPTAGQLSAENPQERGSLGVALPTKMPMETAAGQLLDIFVKFLITLKYIVKAEFEKYHLPLKLCHHRQP